VTDQELERKIGESITNGELDPGLEGVRPTPRMVWKILGDFALWISDLSDRPIEAVAAFRRRLLDRIELEEM